MVVCVLLVVAGGRPVWVPRFAALSGRGLVRIALILRLAGRRRGRGAGNNGRTPGAGRGGARLRPPPGTPSRARLALGPVKLESQVYLAQTVDPAGRDQRLQFCQPAVGEAQV